MKKRYTEEQIIGFLKEAAAGTPVKQLCRKHGFSDASFYLWRRNLLVNITAHAIVDAPLIVIALNSAAVT